MPLPCGTPAQSTQPACSALWDRVRLSHELEELYTGITDYLRSKLILCCSIEAFAAPLWSFNQTCAHCCHAQVVHLSLSTRDLKYQLCRLAMQFFQSLSALISKMLPSSSTFSFLAPSHYGATLPHNTAYSSSHTFSSLQALRPYLRLDTTPLSFHKEFLKNF